MIEIPNDLLHQWRADTPGVQTRTHLNNAGAALPPRQVVNAMVEHLLLESEIGGYEAHAARVEEIAGFYAATARLLNTSPSQIAWMTSATDAYNRALTSVPWREGDVILTTVNDYVSNQIAFMQLQQRFGIRVVRAEDDPKGGVSLDSMERLMDQLHPRLVAVTHVPTNSGLVQPVTAIGRLCAQRERETLYLVDACQSAGQLPLDVQTMQCDFLSATFRKFLRGPRGAGFLYVSPKVLDLGLAPLTLDLYSATWTEKDVFVMQNDARRFELWEKSYALMMGAKAAVEYALDAGLENIESRVKKLAAHARERLVEIPGLKSLDQGEELCGIVTFTFPGREFSGLKAHLAGQQINLSFAPRFVAVIDLQNKGAEWVGRLSPHYYNTLAELDQAVESIRNWASP